MRHLVLTVKNILSRTNNAAAVNPHTIPYTHAHFTSLANFRHELGLQPSMLKLM